MKIVTEKQAKTFKYASTSSCLDYSIDLNEKKLDFCINTITGRYPEKGYCTNLECEEICYILDGSGKIFVKNNDAISFNKGDIIFINKEDIYYWRGNFKLVIVCTPAWSKDQCKLIDE
ncbi:MAG: cupin domain-containing protein [Bacilli bacterium]|nr:cupin domain-containing protein [Bacilli bacterium]